MPSFEELGRQYAGRVVAAVEEDARRKLGYVVKALASRPVSPSELPYTGLAQAIKDIAHALDGLRTGKGTAPTEEHKNRALRETGRALGLVNPDEFVTITKAVCGNAYATLPDRIASLARRVMVSLPTGRTGSS